MQPCLRPLAYRLAELHFQRYYNGSSDPKGNENITYTMVKYGETFYGRHTALTPVAAFPFIRQHLPMLQTESEMNKKFAGYGVAGKFSLLIFYCQIIIKLLGWTTSSDNIK